MTSYEWAHSFKVMKGLYQDDSLTPCRKAKHSVATVGIAEKATFYYAIRPVYQEHGNPDKCKKLRL